MTDTTSFRAPLFALAATMLWGCGQQMAGPAWYQSPTGLTGATGATVSMSDNQAAGSPPDGDTRVVTVDGVTVSPMEFDKVVLPPGPHTLGVQYNGAAAAGTVPIRATLQGGASYTVRGSKDGPCDASLWLADHDQVMGDRLETHLVAKSTAMGAGVAAVACN